MRIRHRLGADAEQRDGARADTDLGLVRRLGIEHGGRLDRGLGELAQCLGHLLPPLVGKPVVRGDNVIKVPAIQTAEPSLLHRLSSAPPRLPGGSNFRLSAPAMLRHLSL